MELEGAKPFHITRWLAEPGTFLQAGATLAEIAGDTLGPRRSTLHAPVHGWVSEIHVPRDKNGFAIGHHGLRDAQLVTMTSYDSTYLVPQAHAVVPQNFLASIQQDQQALEQQRAADRQRRWREEAEQERLAEKQKRDEAEAKRIANLQQRYRDLRNAHRTALDEVERLQRERSSLYSCDDLDVETSIIRYCLWIASGLSLMVLFFAKAKGWFFFDYIAPLFFPIFTGAMELAIHSDRKKHARVSILYEQAARKIRPVLDELDKIRAELPWQLWPS